MIPVQVTIEQFRRSLTVSAVIRRALICAGAACLMLEMLGQPKIISGAVLMMGVAGIWLMLSYRSAKGSRLTAITPQLIAAGNLAQAEQIIHHALASFSLFRSVKLRGLHQLAVLRNAQERWAECASLCRELLRHPLGNLAPLSRSTRLMLANSLLQCGDLAAAYQTINSLYSERLSLGEALELTAVQLDYLSRAGHWKEMLQGLRQKLSMIELMPPARSAMCHALLCLAARRLAMNELADWLRLRTQTAGEPAELVGRRAELAEIWTPTQLPAQS